MKAHWWSCVLGLLCMPAEVILHIWTASQNPSSISLVRVNSSAEITCSTSLSEPMGLSVYRRFHSKTNIAYLALEGGEITRNTVDAEFEGRLHIGPNQQIREGYRFTLQLSLLGLEDTNLYYCSWTYLKESTYKKETLASNGTVIIIRESSPQEQCKDPILDLTLISLSIAAFTLMLFLCIGALILRCKRFKKHFRPARAANPPRLNRTQHICPQQEVQHCPYLITSASTSDFRVIL